MSKPLFANIRTRVEVAANAASDDFGHDTQALLEWESDQLTTICEQDIPKLLEAIDIMYATLIWYDKNAGLSEYFADNYGAIARETLGRIASLENK